jgi:membrane-associated phospholipid phosphatase
VHPQGFANTPGFPSGHASNAFAGWIFVFFYIGAKTNIWQSSLAHPWKWLFMIGFLIFPVWIASTRVVDHFHFVSQVLTGGFIGITCAIIGYGTNYCSFFGDDCFVPIYYHWRKAAILENERKRAQVFDKVSV